MRRGHHLQKSQKWMTNLKVLFPQTKTLLKSACHLVPSGWFEVDKEHNHNVYVSGLPHDVTKEEFVEMMSKCGIIMENEDGTFDIEEGNM